MGFDIRQELVRSLAEAVRRGGRSLDSVPGLLRRVVVENAWQHRIIDDRESVLGEFKDFVEREYPEGLSTTLLTLEALCQNEPDLKDFLADAKRGKHGGARLKNSNGGNLTVDARGNVVEKSKSNNITLDYKRGTSAEYAYNKLRDEAYNDDGSIKSKRVASIHKRVISGEISPHGGMVEAGFRQHKVAVNMNNPKSAARTITKYMDRDQLVKLIDLLHEQLKKR